MNTRVFDTKDEMGRVAASILQTHPDCLMFLDTPAASLL